MQELQDRAEKAKDSNEELMKVGREIVDFHGEMVLLENYSALNYTGICLPFLWLVKSCDLCGLSVMDSSLNMIYILVSNYPFGDIVNVMVNGLQIERIWQIRMHIKLT